jgi:hypothetical protein
MPQGRNVVDASCASKLHDSYEIGPGHFMMPATWDQIWTAQYRQTSCAEQRQSTSSRRRPASCLTGVRLRSNQSSGVPSPYYPARVSTGSSSRPRYRSSSVKHHLDAAGLRTLRVVDRWPLALGVVLAWTATDPLVTARYPASHSREEMYWDRMQIRRAVAPATEREDRHCRDT